MKSRQLQDSKNTLQGMKMHTNLDIILQLNKCLR